MSETLKAWERIKKGIDTNIWECGYWDDIEIIEKGLKEYEGAKHHIEALHKERVENSLKLKALNEILALHDKWLGNEMSDFEFFTLLSEIKDKYDLLKEVLK